MNMKHFIFICIGMMLRMGVFPADASVLAPIDVSGFNFDSVADAGSTVSASTTGPLGDLGDGGGDNPFETGFQGNNHGLPVDRTIVSDNDPDITYRLQSYSALNTLRLRSRAGQNSGTLSLVSPSTYNSISLLAFGVQGGSQLSIQLNFSDETTQNTTWDVQDWYTGPGSSAIDPVSSFYRVTYEDNTIDARSFSFFEVVVNLSEANRNKVLTSISLTETITGNSEIDIFALSGDCNAIPEPAPLAFFVLGSAGVFLVRRGRQRRSL
ncbi:MAG: hypothetical protein PHP44_03285 [Kiritimatiellae bacterium]|nr:hypothetical protein [Kiritimatiellia bacterium]